MDEDEPIMLDDSTDTTTEPSTSNEDVIEHDTDSLNEEEDDFDSTEEQPIDSTTENEDEMNQPTDQAEQENPNDPTAGMDDKQRNAYFAQQRIAAKQAAEQSSNEFISKLRDQSQAYVDQVDTEKYEDIDETVASQLLSLEKFQRQAEVDKAIAQVERARESTALSFSQAETTIPMFNPSDKESYQPELHKEAMTDWAEAYLVTEQDEDGVPQIVGTKQGAPSPLEYLTQKASRYENVLKSVSAQSQAIAQRNHLAGETPGVQQTVKKDTALDAFDEEYDRYG